MAKQDASIEPSRRAGLPEIDWDDMIEAGAYAEIGTGDLYRFPKEARVKGGSPHVTKKGHGASRLAGILNVTTMKAWPLCAQHNFEPSF
ncbi:hypothetical protein FG93_04877 [Bosea sp. LC85]|uniref:hypothetical protein n=1 Tax=Bosea sp. LC85 TaxID=1502851 RepID=UPI0004E2F91A|nr:hypothetical protein [Bosea sp. LC85]KFC65336.1 hypothetical protein FG93_04877 [Bosea sp. LC85]